MIYLDAINTKQASTANFISPVSTRNYQVTGIFYSSLQRKYNHEYVSYVPSGYQGTKRRHTQSAAWSKLQPGMRAFLLGKRELGRGAPISKSRFLLGFISCTSASATQFGLRPATNNSTPSFQRKATVRTHKLQEPSFLA